MITKIDDNIYIGNGDDARTTELLQQYGIELCYNVAFDLFIQNEKILRVSVGLVDGHGNLDEQIKMCVKTLNYLFESGFNKIMVHCHEGRSRSVCVVALHFALKYNKNFIEELNRVASIRSLYKPNSNLVKDFARVWGIMLNERLIQNV